MKLNKIFFMTKKLLTDLEARNISYKISDDLTSQELGEYYFKFEEDPSKLNKLISDFDKNGVPLNTTYVDVKEKKLHYYPISIGQYGLAVFNSYKKSSDKDKLDHFLRITNWFYENKIEDKELGNYWLTDVPKPEYKVFEPWKSAFSQSRAISVFLRAWQITNNEKYLEAAKKSLLVFEKDITENGVAAFTKYGKFYEEYVATEPTMVLDGHIFSLFGLYDFVKAVPIEIDSENHNRATKLFNEGIESLIKWLPEYDMGFWLKFNMCRMPHYPELDPCTIGYLNLVVKQLEVLYKITERKEILDFVKKFAKYNNLPNIFKMYYYKFKALKKMNRL